MKDNYPAVIERVYAYEGGFSNVPQDPGGPTQRGITIFDVRKYVDPSLSAGPPWTQHDIDVVRALTKEKSDWIYKSKYWDKILGDLLYYGVDLAAMDPAVNSGIGKAQKWLRQVLKMNSSGPIDQTVINLVNAAAGSGKAAQLCRDICDIRLSFLHALTTWEFFGKGWGRRVADVCARSVAMASAAHPLAQSDSHAIDIAHAELTKDAAHHDVEVAKAKKNMQQTGTVATGTAGADAAQAHPATSLQLDETTLIILAIIAVIAIGASVYFFWKWRKHGQLGEAAKQVAQEVRA